MLRRSPLLLGALLAYPIVIALLVGLVAGYASSKPRVAYVDEDDVPAVVQVGGQRFHVQSIIDEVAQNVTLVPMSRGRGEARARVRQGRRDDHGAARLRRRARDDRREPEPRAATGSGARRAARDAAGAGARLPLNRKLQGVFIKANLVFVRLILHGGKGSFLGQPFTVLGLDRTEQLLAAMPQIAARADDPRTSSASRALGLAQTGTALAGDGAPDRAPPAEGEGPKLAALRPGAVVRDRAHRDVSRAAARRGRRGGRARRGNDRAPAPRARVARRSSSGRRSRSRRVVGLALGGAIAVMFGIVAEVGGVTGGEPWARLPLLLVGIALAAAVVGAAGALLGALAREARTASLLAVLVVLPVVFLGLVPREALAFAWWVSEFLPFAHAVRWFGAALYDTSPWRTLGVETLWLLGIGAVLGVLARLSMRRLAA